MKNALDKYPKGVYPEKERIYTPLGYFALKTGGKETEQIAVRGRQGQEDRKMAEGNTTNSQEWSEAVDGRAGCCCHRKTTPREEKELKALKNRLNRMTGQLSGIGKMLDENRYCGDVLVQVAAEESALQSFAYLILQEHMETCVVEEIRKGNLAVVDEAVELMKKLK